MANFLRNVLSSNAHWNVNKIIAQAVGTDAAILLSDLISKRSYFADKNQLEPDGSFFNTAKNIEGDCGFSERVRIAAQKILVDAGLVVISKRGLPARNFFIIQDNVIFDLIDKGPVLPAEIDVTTSHCETQSLQNVGTSHCETQSLVTAKRSDSPISNKNKDNNNKPINDLSSDSSPEDRVMQVIASKVCAFASDRSMPTHEKNTLPSDIEARLITLRDSTLVEDKEKVISRLESLISARLNNPKIEFLKDLALNLVREVWIGEAPVIPTTVSTAPEFVEQEHPLQQEFLRWAVSEEGKVRKHICTVEFYEEYKRLKERGEV